MKSGDTINSIAHQFNITERALILWNNLSKPYALHIGEIICLASPKLASTKRSSNAINVNSNAVVVGRTNGVESGQKFQPKPGALKFVVQKEVLEKHEIAQKSGKIFASKPLDIYTVKAGDTLLNIAITYQMTLEEIAGINDLRAPYNIFVGQKLEVYKTKQPAKEREKIAPVHKKFEKLVTTKEPLDKIQTPLETKVNVKPVIEKVKVEKATAEESKTKSNVIKDVSEKPLKLSQRQSDWQAPLKSGMDFVKVGENGETLFKANAGQSVYASQDGEVLYAGVGTRGYGEMVIVSHKGGYLTAYRNLESISVSEGQVLVRGQEVGEVGAYHGESDFGFEVRKDGVIIPAKNLWK